MQRKHLSALGLDRAVALVIATRIWQVVAGPVTLLLIASHFSAEVQGYYYAFLSVIALQSFVELGLTVAVMNIASHESVKLTMNARGSLSGDSVSIDRLASLARAAFKWFSGGTLIFVAVAGAAGYEFLATREAEISWQAQWFLVIILAGLQFLVTPFNSLLEACGRIADVSAFRLAQAVLGSVATWCALLADMGLWVTSVSLTVIIAINLALLLRYRGFFKQLWTSRSTGARIDWKKEVLPMQWRLAFQGAINYFLYSLYVPVIFHYHGSAEAGRVGMTVQILALIQGLALSWVTTKAPGYAAMAARRDFDSLDAEWRRNSSVAMIVTGLGVVLLPGAIMLARYQVPLLADRVLGPAEILLFGLAHFCSVAVQCMATYFRAHKREVLTLVGLVSGVLCGFLVWTLGSLYGASGAAAASAMVNVLVTVPWTVYLWVYARRQLH
jgi:hypothetical protein